MKTNSSLGGIITALVTPFKNQKVDLVSLKNLVRKQLDEGIQGFVVSGTTGESPTLNFAEKKLIFQTVRRMTPKELPVIVGTGTNSTAESSHLTIAAEEWGADAALVVVPYYNKPTQEGLYQHFSEIAHATTLPIFLYNVPSRTVAALSIETIDRLSQIPNIVGIKEASGKMDFDKQLIEKVGKDFIYLSGDDVSFAEFLQLGGQGVISVTSHVLAAQMLEVQRKVFDKNPQAIAEWKKYLSLTELLFIESNPICVKAALYEQKVIQSDELRLPLIKMSTEHRKQMVAEMKQKGIL